MKKTIGLFLGFLFLLPLFFNAGCAVIGDDDLYISGTITGEVRSIPNAAEDIRVKFYKLEGIGPDYASAYVKDNYTYSFWFVVEYSGFPARRGRISYLVAPTVESHTYISPTIEVVFIPISRVATFEEDMPDDTVLRNNDFDTVLTFK